MRNDRRGAREMNDEETNTGTKNRKYTLTTPRYTNNISVPKKRTRAMTKGIIGLNII